MTSPGQPTIEYRDTPWGRVASATVELAVAISGHSSFACPACGRRIRFLNAYPASFSFRSCGGCHRVWSNSATEIGPHRNALAGRTLTIQISALENTDRISSEPSR